MNVLCEEMGLVQRFGFRLVANQVEALQAVRVGKEEHFETLVRAAPGVVLAVDAYVVGHHRVTTRAAVLQVDTGLWNRVFVEDQSYPTALWCLERS